MATPSVTLATPRALRMGNTQFCMIVGDVSVISYDDGHPELVALTGQFKSGGVVRAFPDGVTTEGYAAAWDETSKSFKLYETVSTGGILTEVASATSGGSFGFFAVGQLGL